MRPDQPWTIDGLAFYDVVDQQQMETVRLLSSYKDNVLMRGLYMTERIDGDDAKERVAKLTAPVVTKDGKVLTQEMRAEIAASRPKYDVDKAIAKELDYINVQPVAEGEFGVGAQKERMKQPEMAVVLPIALPDPEPTNVVTFGDTAAFGYNQASLKGPNDNDPTSSVASSSGS